MQAHCWKLDSAGGGRVKLLKRISGSESQSKGLPGKGVEVVVDDAGLVPDGDAGNRNLRGFRRMKLS